MIRAALFDLGETLLTYGDERTIFRLYLRGLKEVYEALSSSGRPLPNRKRFERVITRRLKLKFFISHFQRKEMKANEVARDALKSMGLTFSDEEFDRICRVTFSHIRESLSLAPGAVESLKAARELRLKTAVVSNVVIPSFLIEEDVAAFGLAELTDTRLYSVDVGRRKPDPRIFLQALSQLGVEPSQAAFVGDKRYPDVWGAGRLGMRTVLVLSGSPGWWPLGRPDAVIQSLEQLPPILRRWSMD